MDRKCKHRNNVHEVDLFKTLEEASEETVTMADLGYGLEKLIDYLEETKFEHCERCGGVHPELMFRIFDRRYYFTLWKIEDRGKAVIETDYNTLRKYLNECAR